MPSLRSNISLADTKRLQRLQTPRNPVYSTTKNVFDAKYNSIVQTIVNQSHELTKTSTSDAKSQQGLSGSEFEDLDYVLSRATSIANSCPEEEAAGQLTKTFQAGTADNTEVQSMQELLTTTVSNSDKDLDAIAKFLNSPSNKRLPNITEIYIIEELGIEPKNQDLAQNCNTADTIDIILDLVVPPIRPDIENALSDSSRTQLTSAKNQYLPRDQLPNYKKNANVSLCLYCKYSPICQTDLQCKQAISDYISTTVSQSSKQKKPDLAKASPKKRVRQGKLYYIKKRPLC